VLRQDLPTQTYHHLLKSITWTEVDAVPIKNPLRRFLRRIAQRGRWVASVQQRHYTTDGRMIYRLLRIRTVLGRFRGRYRLPILRDHNHQTRR
jgi:hypothetical protein